MTIINPGLAKLMADLNNAWVKLLDEQYDEVQHFGTFKLKVYTDDGYTATFYEEGIDFYPEEDK